MDYQHIISRTFRRFFIPTIIGTLSLNLIQISNLVLVGYFFGKNGSFTIGLVLPVVIFTEIVSYLFGIGGGIAISSGMGGGDKEKANDVFTISIALTLVIGVLVAVLGTVFIDGVIRLLGVTDNGQLLFVRGYVKTLFMGMPILLLSSVLNILIRNDGKPAKSMLGVLCAAIVNVAFIFLFMNVLGNDIKYIALSMVLSHAVALILYISHFLSRHSVLKWHTKPNVRVLADMVKPGVSGAMIFFAQMVLTVFINRVLKNNVGYVGIATYGVIKYVVSFEYAIYDGINHAAQPMFGVYKGEGDNRSIQCTAKVAIKMSIGCGLLLTLLLIVMAPVISRFFQMNDNHAVYIIGASCIFAAIVAFFTSYYRSVGKEKASFALILLDNLAFPVVIIFLLVNGMGLGAYGVWFALLFSEVLTLAVIFLWNGRNVFLLGEGKVSKDRVFDVIIQSQETDIVALNSSIEEFCEKNGIDAKKQYYIFLCIEEIAVNIIKHGFSQSADHYIHIRITVGQDVVLTIRDDAVKFDPTLRADAEVDTKSSLEERDIGGLGIYLVRRIAKEFSYKRIIGFNSLHIVL